MKINLTVRSTVIDWIDSMLEVTDTDGNRHIIPLGQSVTVTMVGYPDRVQKTMLARDLGDYMIKGYIIEQIEREDGKGDSKV